MPSRRPAAPTRKIDLAAAPDAAPPRRPRGRPRGGPDGASVRSLPALNVRLAPGEMAVLRAAGKVLNVAPSAIVAAALQLWLARQPKADRADIERQAARDLRAAAPPE